MSKSVGEAASTCHFGGRLPGIRFTKFQTIIFNKHFFDKNFGKEKTGIVEIGESQPHFWRLLIILN